MITFKSSTNITVIAYLTPTFYEYVRFDSMSNGSSYFITEDVNLANALMQTTEFKQGRITTDHKPEEVKETKIETPVEETIQAPAEEESKETPVAVEDDAEKNELTFPDAASAKQYLMETYDCKSSELRSLKAIKEKFAELCINVTIED